MHLPSRKVYGKVSKTKKSSELAKLMMSVFNEVDVPVDSILSDCGKEFQGYFKKLMSASNVELFKTLPYNPSQNGRIERFHSTMKKRLRIFVADNPEATDNQFKDFYYAWIKQYNEGHYHSALKMTPQEFIDATNVKKSDPKQNSSELREKLALAKYTWDKSKIEHEKAISRASKCFNKGATKYSFKKDMCVFISPPASKRRKEDVLYCLKGRIIEYSVKDGAFVVEFQESGGWLKSHKPFTKCLITSDMMKPYEMGSDDQLRKYVNRKKRRLTIIDDDNSDEDEQIRILTRKKRSKSKK